MGVEGVQSRSWVNTMGGKNDCLNKKAWGYRGVPGGIILVNLTAHLGKPSMGHSGLDSNCRGQLIFSHGQP